MYVRWKRRDVVPTHPYRDWNRELWREERKPLPPYRLLSAVLVENKRIDGKPRQRIVQYLGSLRERELEDTDSLARFWERAERRLDELGLDEPTRERAVRALDAVAVRPSAEEVQRYRERAVARRRAYDEVIRQLSGRSAPTAS
jgi:hypothetical protein